MWQWIKKHSSTIVMSLVTIGFLFYCYGCEPQVRSLLDNRQLINRQEFQLELDQFMSMAEIRMLDFDRQEKLRAVILQNALILVQGQPLNPVGIISAVAAIYGVMQGSSNLTKVVKTRVNKRKVNNG